jgi:hypothetical protein
MMRWLKDRLVRWLLADIDARLLDLERHFVTRRDQTGKVTETLADVPLKERKERTMKMAGMSWAQRRAWLEATDGGRRAISQ